MMKRAWRGSIAPRRLQSFYLRGWTRPQRTTNVNSSRPVSNSKDLKKLHPEPARRWDADGIRYFIQQDYAIIERLSKEFSVVELCEIAGVSRSGYYKWKKRAGKPPKDRQKVLGLVEQTHTKHLSHGYRWIHAYLKRKGLITASAEYVRRAFGYLGIESKTKHKRRDNPRKRKDPYPNLVFATWETVDRPRQVIVSDMTAFWTRLDYWELTLYFDVFTKEILGRGITRRRGCTDPYYEGLEQAIKKITDHLEYTGDTDEMSIIHTYQGSVYTSMAYNEIIKDKNIVRSCSRAGKPTDNPAYESLNGWIKEELIIDFDLYNSWDVPRLIDEYIAFYNTERPSYSLGYATPCEYYQLFIDGEIEHKDTFKNRVLDETPKFIQERRKKDDDAPDTSINGDGLEAINDLVSTIDAWIMAPVSTNEEPITSLVSTLQ